MNTYSLTAYYGSAAEAVTANKGQLRPTWCQPTACKEGDTIGIHSEERHAIIYRAVDSDGQSFYTYVGSNEVTYTLVEKWRMKHHNAVLYLPCYHEVFYKLLGDAMR